MRRISKCVTRRRSRRGWSLIILFKSMSLNQCTFAIFFCLFTCDLWPFGLSINTTATGREDVRFTSSMPVQQTTLKKLGIPKNNMNSITLKFFMSMAIMCCATADVPCNASVGIESGDLPDNSFHASSHRSGHFPYLGRLNNRIKTINETKRIWGAWCAEDVNQNQYIEVDLLAVRNVTGLATQGYLYGSVTSYHISYSINKKQWFDYKNNSTMKSKIFIGNSGTGKKDSIVRHKLNRLLEARYIRFNPVKWSSLICMRVEIYACEVPKVEYTTTTPSPLVNTKTASNFDAKPTRNNEDEQTTVAATKQSEEISTFTEFESLDNGRNSGSKTYCSVFVLFICALLVLNKFIN